MIEVNIQVRSMGPISENDMVSWERNENPHNYLIITDLFHGLLFPSVMAGQTSHVFWSCKSHFVYYRDRG